MVGVAYVLGVDAGGTASRAVLADRSGVVLGRGTAGPGNPSATGTEAARAIGSAVRSALGGLDPAEVVAGVVGVAGISGLADPAVAAEFSATWSALGLAGRVTVVADAVTALAAGGLGPEGVVLISGTGAVAALVDGVRVVRAADGLGWVLGDEGSGLWLGLQAVRAAARQWSAHPSALAVRSSALTGDPPALTADPPTSAADPPASAADPPALVEAVAAHAGVVSADELVAWAGTLPLASVAALAPVVCALADAGEPLARRIVADGVARLVATLDELDAADHPVVLAGGLLTNDTPIRRGVLSVLEARGVAVGTATDPALGAARLAASGL